MYYNYAIMTEFTDDEYCFVCGRKNPAGLKLDFSCDGKIIKTRYTPPREHQGYKDIVHGGIIATLLDEVMVKLAIERGMPAVTAQMDIRLMKAARIGEPLLISAEIDSVTRKLIEARASAVTEGGTVVAEAKGKLVRVDS